MFMSTTVPCNDCILPRRKVKQEQWMAKRSYAYSLKSKLIHFFYPPPFEERRLTSIAFPQHLPNISSLASSFLQLTLLLLFCFCNHFLLFIKANFYSIFQMIIVTLMTIRVHSVTGKILALK